MDEVLALNQQIAELQKKSSEAQKKNRPGILTDLREKMHAYSITAQELTSPEPKARKIKSEKIDGPKPAQGEKVKKVAAVVVPKFKGPDGQTWTGRGTAPNWIKELISAGRSKEEFLIVTAPLLEIPATF